MKHFTQFIRTNLRHFYPADFKILHHLMAKMKQSGIEDVWVGLDMMSDESIVSNKWIKNTGNVGTEVPWTDGAQTSNASLKCTFMSAATKGYAYLHELFRK